MQNPSNRQQARNEQGLLGENALLFMLPPRESDGERDILALLKRIWAESQSVNGRPLVGTRNDTGFPQLRPGFRSGARRDIELG